MSASIYDIPVKKITGEDTSLAEFKGKVLLVVNVASKCGLTPQYEGLEKIYEQYKGQGLVVAGFPANDFKSQEPGTEAEIQSFCTLNYGVKFPMFSKITVVGAEKHPLYAALIAAQPKAVSLAEVPFREKLKGYGIEANPEPELRGILRSFSSAAREKWSSGSRRTRSPMRPRWSPRLRRNWRRTDIVRANCDSLMTAGSSSPWPSKTASHARGHLFSAHASGSSSTSRQRQSA